MTAPLPAEGAPVAAAPQRFHIHQKITPFQNVYRVFSDANGQPGPLIACVKQKRMALREAFTVYRDEAATVPVMGIKADRKLDISSTMSVTDTNGQLIGKLRKKGAASILRSTWELEQEGLPIVTVTERSMLVAILRRFWSQIPYIGDLWIPWVFHFDGKIGERTVLTHTRHWGIRDHYVLETMAPELDSRLAIALAIMLDAMQHR